ncbi:MAG: hypothetical protein JSW27_17735 [Phycisphaerales bacterium]|nr:MAG: hypothetical protein JSW27_17735 [Phycisphaerales bacterium]
MRSNLTKVAAVAAIFVAISAVTLFSSKDSEGENLTSFVLLSRVAAAERALFAGDEVVHIVNEITVWPTAKEADSKALLDQLASGVDERSLSHAQLEALDHQLLKSWLVGSLPVCSLQSDGTVGASRIELAAGRDDSYTLLDHAWYEPATRRFARVMKAGDKAVFANAFDGDFVHTSLTAPDGTLRLTSQPVTGDFQAPANPVEFLGLSAGVRLTMSEENLFQPIQDIHTAVLHDGSPVTVYQVGFADFLGNVSTYCLFKVLDRDETVAEIEYILAGRPKLVIRRILSESVPASELSWNLAELNQADTLAGPDTEVSVESDIAIVDISVRHMVETASFETYIFSQDPPWTQKRIITDMLDQASPPHRAFAIIYYAEDGRHVIFGQSRSQNTYFASGQKFSETQSDQREWKALYVSPGSVKIYRSGGAEWWTEIGIKQAGLEPADDRCGYIFETPSKTFIPIAINGPLTEAELHSLADALIPARQHVTE